MGHIPFRPKLLASAVTVAMLAANAQVANAAEGADEAVDETIVITGIRGSLMRAMDMKRDAQGVVDGISSEDIGKFPDTNLAESLQRITGVSIDRSNGEGSKITVRGLGSDFNLVTLNGRQMPTSGLTGTAINSSRSFDFANIASEAVSGVEVYKTSRADISTGGIGATVNVLTARPLNDPGLNFAVGVKGVIDKSTDKGDSITPEISGIYSQTFADDKFGIAISASHQERNGGNKQANIGNWHTQTQEGVDQGGWFSGGMDNADQANVLGKDDGFASSDTFNRPQNFGYEYNDFERTRDNAQLVVQFAPSDALTFTADYTYTKNEITNVQNRMSAWFWEGERIDAGNGKSLWTGDKNKTPLVWHSLAGPDLTFGTAAFGEVHENKSLGFNVEWDVSDNLSFEFDAHDSTAESGSASPFGNSSVVEFANGSRLNSTIDFRQDFPVIGIETTPGNDASADEIYATGSSLRNSQFTNDVSQVQLKGKYTFDEGVITSVDFGIGATENTVQAVFMKAERATWGGEGTPENIDDGIFSAQSSSNTIDNLSNQGIDANGNPYDVFDLFYTFSTQDATDQVASFAAPDNSADNVVDPAVWPCADRFCVTENWTTDERVKEEMLAAYMQANFEVELGDMYLKGAAGFRYEQTDVTSNAMVPAYTAVNWVSNNEFETVDSGESAFTEFSGDYSNFLPNLDLSLEITDDLKVRTSFSETIARATYNHLRGGVAITSLRSTTSRAERGEPGLLPHESQNFDLSVEWYFDDASYASIGYFHKKVENYVGSRTQTQPLFDLKMPANGPRAADARANISDPNDQGAIRQYLFDNYGEADGVFVTGQDASGNPTGYIQSVDGDPAISFETKVPFNEKEATIDGVEIALQHTFESGFGAQVNYTFVESDAEYDPNVFNEQFALPGLSDTANVVAFYDKDGIQVRIAYNWRDAFLNSTDNGNNNPRITEEYSQIDVNASYDVTEQVTVFVEAINLTDETQRMHSRYQNELLNAIEQGARYNIGARFTF
ncbi:TonB-dependent receptor [Catenovulum sediminis]|uniref:TonB-dependent receptor n=1 Tax=Catenovulum sediminis TaxID=1740262 RepID=A0ABV1RLQ4_9ALTE|nr:TonB-dependent receptor [Catenovulum sediminis]